MHSTRHKHIIYQLLVRHFGNRKSTNKYFGTLEENGCGKFNDITDKALSELRAFGVTHIWYTGILEHATLTDYSAFGIAKDHPQIVKGIAGSPYAIKDYYDVDPDLAENITQRLSEFEALIHRTKENGLKSIIDFVPNHVARSYRSDQKPQRVKDFGEDDDKQKAFCPNNNFYYIPREYLTLPSRQDIPISLSDGDYQEFPARATGNDVFNARPSIHDWYDTIKLNFGVDYLQGRKAWFHPLPDTWKKMKDILSFWVSKGVDGFRCDMAEMVPVEFWAWVIPQLKAINPELIFIAEIYNPGEYHRYIHQGCFDYLYDKVGLYDALRRLIEGHGHADDITRIWQTESGDISQHMLRFLENHDEQRIASRFFAGNPFKALPAMVLSATLHSGPVMIYSGQEVGVAAEGTEGFQGDDGRTTIYDYWGIPELQAWTNQGMFDGGKLSDSQKKLRQFYRNLNFFVRKNEAIYEGLFYDLQYVNFHGQSPGYDSSRLFSFLRYTENQKLIAVFNFDHQRSFSTHLRIPENVWNTNLQLSSELTYKLTEIFDPQTPDFDFCFRDNPQGIPLELPPCSFKIWQVIG